MFDSERQIRFLYPPIFFLASLSVGIRLDEDQTYTTFRDAIVGTEIRMADWSPAAALAAAGGLVTMIAAGFLISSITVCILRLGFL